MNTPSAEGPSGKILSIFWTDQFSSLNWERSIICEWTFISEHIENYFLPNELSNLINLGKKHLQRHFCSLNVIANQVESQYKLYNLWATRTERLDNNNCLWMYLFKYTQVHCHIEVRNISLNPLRYFVNISCNWNLDLNDIAHCFVVTELCL